MPAPKENKYALGNNGGRPAVYGDPQELESKCNDYFRQCKEEKERPTITGLALFLGFGDKSSLYDYRDKQPFSYIIKRALLKIESCLEQMLTGNNVAGVIFALKNMGWRDKYETELTGKDGKDLFAKMSEEELNDMIAGLLAVEATKGIINKGKADQ